MVVVRPAQRPIYSHLFIYAVIQTTNIEIIVL
jgi:hypothetical protein